MSLKLNFEEVFKAGWKKEAERSQKFVFSQQRAQRIWKYRCIKATLNVGLQWLHYVARRNSGSRVSCTIKFKYGAYFLVTFKSGRGENV